MTVSEVEVDSGSAIATVAPTGSNLDGQTMRLELVERDGQWKFHEVLRFIDLDADRLVTSMGREWLLRNESPEEIESTSCFIDLLDKMSDRDLEALVLDYSLDRFLAFANRCDTGSDAL